MSCNLIVGLHDAEKEHIKKKVFPNLALMKISAFHKARGDTVEFWNALNNNVYGLVYSSKVFDFTPENLYLPENTVKGGTGYGLCNELPPEIDRCFPDYSIYPECNYAIGYITRGCPNHCRWCVVPKKEGPIKPYASWQGIVRQDTNKLVLMDNNILACEYGIEQLEILAKTDYRLDLNQGMDARLVDARIAQLISRLKWMKYIRFSCDDISQVDAIVNAAALLNFYGVKPYRLFIYMLITKDIAKAAVIIQLLRTIGNIYIYAQPERNNGIIPNAAQLEFAQRYVFKQQYRKETWSEYCKARGLYFAAR